MTRSPNGPLRVGIGGPVGSGKTALMEALCKRLRGAYELCAITNDIYTKEDARILTEAGALPPERIMGVETGGCPHTAIREDASINLAAVAEMGRRLPDLDLILIESGGDNLAATFSPELADITIYVIDVAGGEKIPRKGGPGITRSDLLVVNKIDLAPLVGADLSVMEADTRRMRGSRPYVFANLRGGVGVEEIARFIEQAGGLAPRRPVAAEPVAPAARAPEARFPAAELDRLASDILAACGVPIAAAAEAASFIVEADLTGVGSHGVFRMPQYAKALRAGLMTPDAAARVVERGPATAVVDGGGGMGHLAMAAATRTAIELARQSGIGWVGVRNCGHGGAGSVWAGMVVDAGLIGIFGACSGANLMPVFGSAEPLLGTNPIAIGIPAGAGPAFMLDMATSVAAAGKVKSYALARKPLPAGWMMERGSGAPLTDPARVDDGLMVPIGGYKGSGLAIAIGLLAGPLYGGPFGRELRDFAAAQNGPSVNGQFIVALDPARFGDAAGFVDAVARHLADLRAAPPVPGGEPVRVPGERRAALRQERLRDGIPLGAELVAQLDRLAASLGVPGLGERAGLAATG